MIIIYMAVSIVGATITALLAGSQSWVLGLLAAPFGGSLLAAAVVFALGQRHSSSREVQTIPPSVVWC